MHIFTLPVSVYSQRGNIMFPTWEYFVPSVGINSLHYAFLECYNMLKRIFS